MKQRPVCQVQNKDSCVLHAVLVALVKRPDGCLVHVVHAALWSIWPIACAAISALRPLGFGAWALEVAGLRRLRSGSWGLGCGALRFGRSALKSEGLSLGAWKLGILGDGKDLVLYVERPPSSR